MRSNTRLAVDKLDGVRGRNEEGGTAFLAEAARGTIRRKVDPLRDGANEDRARRGLGPGDDAFEGEGDVVGGIVAGLVATGASRTSGLSSGEGGSGRVTESSVAIAG